MAFVNAQNCRITVGDRQWAGDVSDVSSNSTVSTYDVTCLSNSSRALIAGLGSGDMTLTGFVDSANAGTANSQWQDIRLLRQTSAGVPAMIGFDGFTAADPLWVTNVWETNWTTTAAVAGADTFTLTLATTGALDYGKSLFDLAAAQTATANGTAVDNAASSSSGATVVLSVVTVSGTSPTLDVVVQHSADNITYTALTGGTFTQATGTTSQSLTIASAVTINRYTRVAVTIGGSTPSFTFAVGLARV